MSTTEEQKKQLSQWFYTLQDRIIDSYEAMENNPSVFCPDDVSPGKFEKTQWQRSEAGDGGTMAVLRQGRVFEKAGVNVSVVFGQFTQEFQALIPGAEEDPNFWAAGISLVVHPRNPFVPIVHFNTRHIITSRSWFGGGMDLTPTFTFEKDTLDFHQALKNLCERHDPTYYDHFKEWCDRYFYLNHRKEPRGVGGIFYDYLNNNDFEKDFAWTKDVGETFSQIYPQIVERHLSSHWTEEDKNKQLIKRGRYVEFNLIYDRGTQFGLKTNGNIEAILMSLPPVAHWP